MRTFRGLLLCFGLLSSTVSCGEPKAELAPHVARTSGGAVALSYDERVAVVANRSAGVVTVFSLKPERGSSEMVTEKTEIATGSGSEPWAVVIGADDDTAFVVLKGTQQVARITSLHRTPQLEERQVTVGSEPTAIAISPTGKMLFVANWGEGTVSMIETDGFLHRVKLNLNETLVETGVLGNVQPRSALAHPRALVITDNGDQNDDDEMLYATEFFSQPLPGITPDSKLLDFDRNRQGLIYTRALKTGQPGPTISLMPIKETGFADSADAMTSCFPNQLYSASLADGRLYVTSMCTSPRGPLNAVKPADGPSNPANFKTLYHPAVFVVDTTTNHEIEEQGRLLTRVLADEYAADGQEASVVMPLIPNDIAFRRAADGTHSAYVSALGADAVFRLDYDAQGTLREIGSKGARYIDGLPNHGLLSGIAVSQRSPKPFALCSSDALGKLSVVDLATEEVSYPPDTTPTTGYAVAALESDDVQGHRLFATGRDFWSFKGQAWSSCEGCHPGGLSDGVTWFFTRGPRRTISTAGTYDKNPDPAQRNRRLLLWGANVDEIHDVEGIVRTVSGGAGGMLWTYIQNRDASSDCRLIYDGSPRPDAQGSACAQAKLTSSLRNGLNGSLAEITDGVGCVDTGETCDSSRSVDWNYIDTYIRNLRAPQGPTESDDARVQKGAALFEAGGCQGCHGGPGWTVSRQFYEPSAEANGTLPYAKPTELPPLGALREQRYTVPTVLARLNPAALQAESTDCVGAVGENKCTTFRAPIPTTEADAIAYYWDASKQGGDQLRCALRAVGTFPVQGPTGAPPEFVGVAANDTTVLEYRSDGTTLAQGASGFNVPSLFGLSVGAPYFHAGNARTLEEALSDVFKGHRSALHDQFLDGASAEDIDNLVAFLLSIDDHTVPLPIPVTDALGTPLRYDFCQFQ